jgi:hypothetical protein
MIRTVLFAGVAAWLLAGCSSGDDSGAGTPPSTTAGTTVSAPSNTPSSTAATPTTPTATPTPAPPTVTPTVRQTRTAPVLPKAADGNNLEACSDARCEVYVQTGSKVPVSRRVAGFNTLVVSKVAPDGVDFGGSTPNTSVSAGGQLAGATSQLNELMVTTVAIQGTTAILRLRPA